MFTGILKLRWFPVVDYPALSPSRQRDPGNIKQKRFKGAKQNRNKGALADPCGIPEIIEMATFFPVFVPIEIQWNL